MLLCTDQGLGYLRRTSGEEPVVDTAPTRRTRFAIFGALDEPGLQFPVPLAGIDYFNYNVKGRDVQINAFLAGAVNTVTLTDPRLFGKVDGSLEEGVDLHVTSLRSEEHTSELQSLTNLVCRL